MAFKKDLSWASIFLLVLLQLLMPFVQCSRARFQGGMAADDSDRATKLGFEKAEASVATNTVKDSARQVPTGPDPLHHNDNPAGP